LILYNIKMTRGCRGRDCMVAGFTTTCAISVYHHWSCEFEPCSWQGVLDRMVAGFTTTCAISAYHHWSCEFEPCSWQGVLDRMVARFTTTCAISAYHHWSFEFEPCSWQGVLDHMVARFITTCAISAYHYLSCEFEPCSWQGVLNKTLHDKVCQWLVTDLWFSLVSSINKTDHHNINGILLIVALKTIILTCWNSPQLDLKQTSINHPFFIFF
jgi:hypothetical protein